MAFVSGLFLIMIICLIIIGFAILIYVLQSLGLYTIAKRRGINNPWLAWIPVGYHWILGCISDQYQYVAKGKVKSKRKVLLTISIISIVLSVVLSISSVGSLASIATEIENGGYEDDIYEEYIDDSYYDNYEDGYYYYEEEIPDLSQILEPVLEIYGSTMAASVLSLIIMVFAYIALFDLYRSCDPNNATLYLVLGILFSVAQPFFIFACRNKDGGMPPRVASVQPVQPTWQPMHPAMEQPTWQPPVQPAAEQPAWQPPAPPVEPWVNVTEE